MKKSIGEQVSTSIAFRAGRKAAWEGKSIMANPYNDCYLYREWAKGFDSVDREDPVADLLEVSE